jgi:uroporphyrin-III C-methyltransferase
MGAGLLSPRTGMTDAPHTTEPAVSNAATPIVAANAPTPSERAPRRGHGAWPWLLMLAASAAAAWFWYDGERRDERARTAAADQAQRLQALESRIDGLRRDTRSHAQRLQQADATNRVLRDELLGISQRSSILEDQVAKLADASRQGAQALRLDEAELFLAAAEQRFVLSGDLDGAKRAYTLAAGALEGIDAPGMLNLRQMLTQERADLDALKADPARTALIALDAFAAAMPEQTEDALRATPVAADAPWWERMLSKFITITPADPTLAVGGKERRAGVIALQMELTLARAAIEHRDEHAYQAALNRADGWIVRLWPDTPVRRKRLEVSARLRGMSLRPSLPTLGSTLAQLRQQRGQR